jgi:hypothetical protein
MFTITSASPLSKGQGYHGFIRKRAGSSLGQKRALKDTLDGPLMELVS